MKVKNLLLLKKYIVFLCTILVVLYYVSGVHAAKRYCRNSGNWNTTKTWSAASDSIAGASIPGVGDTVYIELGRTVTIDTAYTANCAVLTMGTSKAGMANLIFSLNSSLTVSGNVQIGSTEGTIPGISDGTIIFAPGSVMTVSGSLSLGATELKNKGSLDFSAGGHLKIGNAFLIKVLGKYTAGNGTIEYNGGDQTIAPSNKFGSYNNLTLSGTGLKTTSGVNVKGLLSMEGSAVVSNPITAGSSATLQYKGSAAQITGPEFGVFAGNPATCTFGGSGGVIINNPNGVTLGSYAAISNTLTLASGNLNLSNKMLTLYGPPIVCKGGNLITTDSSALAFVSNAAGIYIPGSVTNLDFLSVISTGGVLLKGDISCNSINLIGKITTGSHTLTADMITGAPGSSNYIQGYLRHTFTAGMSSFFFPVGNATNYTPVTLYFNKITHDGEITVSSTNGQHPNISTSGLILPAVLNHYWTFANNGLGFQHYSAEFTLIAEDIPDGTNTNALAIKKYASGWETPITGNKNALSISALKQTGFGDFVIGAVPLTVVPSVVTSDSIPNNTEESTELPLEKISPTTEAQISGMYESGLPKGTKSTFALDGAPATNNGTFTQIVKITARDAKGNPIVTGGALVSILKISGSGAVGDITDNQNGTYSASITAPAASGSGIFSASINGQTIQSDSDQPTAITLTY